MHRACRFLVVFALSALSVSLAGCDLFGTDGGEDGGPALPEGPAVVAAMQGSEPALWVFDPQTLKRTAVIETENRAPRGVTFSPNDQRWYLTWFVSVRSEEEARNVRAILDPTSGEITRRVATSDRSVGAGPLLYEPVTDHVVGYGDSLDFFDPETLELVREQRLDVASASVAEDRGKLYFGQATEDGNQIHVYDPAEQEISSTIPLSGVPFSFPDVALSPDERYLFATTWQGGELTAPGRFHMVDLETGEVVFEGGPVGKSANLAVGPDGRYVYIDSPGGGSLSLAVSTEKVYRFDVEARELEVLIHWTDGPLEVTGGHGLTADKITMLPGGEAFVILNRAVLIDYRPGIEEVFPPLLKVDAETGEVLATYTLPRNDEGYVRAEVRQLHFGIVPE